MACQQSCGFLFNTRVDWRAVYAPQERFALVKTQRVNYSVDNHPTSSLPSQRPPEKGSRAVTEEATEVVEVNRTYVDESGVEFDG